VSGTLTLSGQSTTFTVTEHIEKGDLTLTGGSITPDVSLPITPATLTLTGQGATFLTTLRVDAGALTLTGQVFFPSRVLPIEHATLTLRPGWIELKQIGGSSGERRKRDPRLKTGLEPVKKRKPPEPDAPAPLPIPPFKTPPLVPVLEPVEIVDPCLIPDAGSLQALQQQINDAHDVAAIQNFLRQLEQDEQDARDIADVLALLD
jgi:hypothetical protein